jgi:YidC/Oxa1 family membrane protein insertase
VIGVEFWQAILNGLGSVLAWLYSLIPSYGIDIIILTIVIRLLLLPLGVKQIRSMQATQALQPKLKALQQKYKNDRQRLYQEQQALYKEYGYNPLSGCLPLLLQLPVLFALFAVLRTQGGYIAQGNGGHIPKSSNPNSLYQAIVHNEPGLIKGTGFLGTNLLCSAVQSGHEVSTIPPGSKPPAGHGEPDVTTLNCGQPFPANMPYYVLALLMVGTTFFQQRQMTRAAPSGTSSQQQAIMRFMPLLFGFWGFIFPAGLVVYWSTTNSIQIGQQWYLLHRKGARYALAKPGETPPPPTKGSKGTAQSKPSTSRAATSSAKSDATGRPSSGGDRRPRGGVVPRRNPGNGNASKTGGSSSSGGSAPNGGRPAQRRQSGGGGNAGSRKKRPKR